MRIVSLLPSATEIVFALGAGPDVVGVSHECDFPPEAAGLPVLTRPAVPTSGRAPAQIDHDVGAVLAAGRSVYDIDQPLLRRLAPDLIVTQALCDVCAVSEGDVHRVVHEQQLGARVLSLTPLDLDGVFASIDDVGDAIGRAADARTLTTALRDQIRSLRDGRPPGARPRVLALEWTDPPFVAGHWVPDQIAAAGGHDVLGAPRRPSFRTTWAEIAAARPDVILVIPCGYTLPQIVAQAQDLHRQPAWRDLPAVRAGRVWALDASAWFSRPGPRLVEGVQALFPILADPDADPEPDGTRRLLAPAADR